MDTVAEIKNRLNIVDIAREYGTLHPSGAAGNFKMICPFHDDHSPSLVVSQTKGLAWCFACNNGGDIFSFVQKIENCSFAESVRLLAEKAGVTPEKHVLETKKDDGERERIFEALEESARYFEKQLAESARAKEILEKRKLSERVLQKFRVGFAPKSEHGLQKHLLENGFSRKEMLSAGLIVAQDISGGEMRDKFRDRIMFPVWNTRERICAFGGRYIGDSEKAPKYLNSPETLVFKKSEILYGINFAKDAIKKEGFAILTEGYFDVIACHSAGIENSVASSGTAFTIEHAALLGRLGKEVALALDRDEAGQTASRRSSAIALKKGLNVSVVSLSGGKDPDEAIRENTADFLEAVKNREKAIEAFFRRAFSFRDSKKIEEKKVILDELLPVIDSLSREIERDHFLHVLAEKLGTQQQVLWEEYRRFSRFALSVPEKRFSQAKQGVRVTSLEYLIGILLSYPTLFEECKKHLLSDLISSREEKKIYKLITETYNAEVDSSPEDVFQKLSPEEAQRWRVLAVYAEEKNGVFSEEIRKRECVKTILNVNIGLIPKKLNELALAMKEKKEDAPALLVQMNELTKLLQKFHHQ